MVIYVLNHSQQIGSYWGLRGVVKAYIFHIVVFQLLILSQSRTVWNFAKPLASIKYNATVL